MGISSPIVGLVMKFLSYQDIEGNMKKHYPIIIEQDKDGVYIVECPLFKGCRSYGSDIAEAVENIREAIEVCIEEDTIDDQSTFIGIRDIELAIA
jgi:predicted RNase H-like HicB family nuclease